MDIEQEGLKPLSPTGQWTSSSFLSLFVIGVLESQVPIDDTQIMPLIPNVFLPINTRFSSIMVMDEKGVKQWKKVEVRLKDHINVPIFTPDRSTEYYDERLDAYLSKLATEQLPQSRPPWEIHIIKYPTSHAAGNIIFKLHHSLGDGFSLMGALLSCLQRVDNPSLPLTFPSSQLHLQKDGQNSGIGKSVVKLLSSAYYTVFGFWSSVIKSNLVEDDKSPIRSGNHGVESLPVSIVTMSFSLDDIKQIKAKLSAVRLTNYIRYFSYECTRIQLYIYVEG
uniref:diacylglycerol O-acyltransferase n=1 Tax=Rhizophora mucronata TaxID=61149 RepID=A0A2P2KBE6_RHIMU